MAPASSANEKMTIEEIKEMIRMVRETGIAELEVQRGENKVRIRNAHSLSQDVIVPTIFPHEAGASYGGGTHASEHRGGSPAGGGAPPASEHDSDVVVKSPIVGTYYDAPSPGAEPFVKVGGQVEVKQVICIIESMKLMNEIEAEVSGIVVAKLVENGSPVEYGESLLTIRPL